MTVAEVTDLSNDFKGISYINGNKVFIDNALPGDVVEISDKGDLIRIIKKSDDRVTPPCSHFDKCGGCNLQYIKDIKYLFYKNLILEKIIKYLGQDINIIEDPISVGRFARRRASFKIDDNFIGYYKQKTHQIFDLKECLILDKQITNLIPKIRILLKKNIFKSLGCHITIADNGIDLIFYIENNLSVEAIKILNIFAQDNKLLRISIDIKGSLSPLYIKDFPYVKLGDTIIRLPESTFLQVSKFSEIILNNLIIEKLKKFKNIIDLYSGIGTYSFPLSRYSKVVSVEGNIKAVEAAKSSIVQNNPQFIVRDLYLNPMTVNELNKFDAIVVNPPRNGAERQIKLIANSRVKNIVMISCNLQTFERDAKILINLGYVISSTKLIDQFYYSKHFEIFTHFVKT